MAVFSITRPFFDKLVDIFDRVTLASNPWIYPDLPGLTWEVPTEVLGGTSGYPRGYWGRRLCKPKTITWWDLYQLISHDEMYHVTWVRPTPGQKSVRCFVTHFCQKTGNLTFLPNHGPPRKTNLIFLLSILNCINGEKISTGSVMVWEKSEVTNFLTKLRTKHRTDFCPGVGRTHVTWYISSWGIDWYRSHHVIVFGLHKRSPWYPRGYPQVISGYLTPPPGTAGYIQPYWIPGFEKIHGIY